LSTNETPAGNSPFSVIGGYGKPRVVTLNELLCPTMNVIALPIVIAGA
jgi:hypothetical protein